ncbi:MAG TPA: SHOCT domain-containing protein [Allosphingosinicella sp.]|nr:SHOCT domain-containing protein [Allosphingosinicella sp.]
MSSRYDALERLQRLRESGALTDEEFQVEKGRLLGHQSIPAAEAAGAPEPQTPSRRRIWIVLGVAALVVAILAGLYFGRTSGGDDGIIDLPMPTENEAADSNLVEAKALPDVRALPPAEQLARAFEAAFGSRGEAMLSVPGDGADEAVRYAPGRLIWPAFGPVLVSEGRVQDPAHASAGKIAIHYLKPAGDRFEVVRAFPAAVSTGSSGQVAEWSLNARFSNFPVVAAEGGGTWQGRTCSWLILTELRPDGPAKLADVPLVYDDTGAKTDGSGRTIEGKILNIAKNQSFDIVYSGARAFSEHYVRDAGGYTVAGGKSTMETC